MTRIAVIGLGNELMGDDGIGLRAIEELRKAGLPENFELLDLGTPGLGLASYIHGYDRVIFVDAVLDCGPPGSVKIYTREELIARPSGPRLSPHDPAVREALLLAELEGAPADAMLVGVVPEDCRPGVGVTPAIEAALPEIVRAVMNMVTGMIGLEPRHPHEDRYLERELHSQTNAAPYRVAGRSTARHHVPAGNQGR